MAWHQDSNWTRISGPSRKDLRRKRANYCRKPVYVCRTGQEALDAAATYRPDAALIEVGLPVMDGYELARRLREQPDLLGMTLIAVTASTDQRSRLSSREAGFARHLLKPVEPGELRETLATVLETKNHPLG
jgi:CheY-like chemotaxis protein